MAFRINCIYCLTRALWHSEIQFTPVRKESRQILNKLQTNALIQFHNNNYKSNKKKEAEQQQCNYKGENKISCNFAVTAKHLTRSAAVQYNAKTLDELSATMDAWPNSCVCVCLGVSVCGWLGVHLCMVNERTTRQNKSNGYKETYNKC